MLFSASPLLGMNLGQTVTQIWEQTLLPRWQTFKEVFVGEDLFLQLCMIIGAWLLAYVIRLGLRPLFKKLTEAIEERDDWVEGVVDWFSDNLFRVLLVTFMWAFSISIDSFHRGLHERELEQGAVRKQVEALVTTNEGGTVLKQSENSVSSDPATIERKNYVLLRAVASFATLWLVSGALPRRIKQRVYFRTLFFVLAIALILNLLGVLPVLQEGLNRIRIFPISDTGETLVTALTLVKGILAVLILIPLTAWVMTSLEKRVAKMEKVSPALQVLIVKFLKVLIGVSAVLFAVSAMGVNLSAFAVLGGAVGLGLGFGFQKVVSNLVSGVILLGDRSIKPGDVIEVDNTYGWINNLGARYASVITRDGTEHLIPNEMLITEKVVNWSFSDDKVRIKAAFGVSYNSDIHKAMELAVQAANENTRVLQNPAPVVRLMEFGDNSVNFELRIWIRDPNRGVNNVKSQLFVRIWDLFHENGIEFPYPQRDLHIVDSVPLKVEVGKIEEKGSD